MNRDCKCGGHICSYINFNNLAECCDCNKLYVSESGERKEVSKIDFKILYRKELIEFQKSNKMEER